MNGFLDLILPAWGAVAALMSVLWWRQVRTHNANWVDVAWAGSTGGLGVYFAIAGEGDPLRRLALAMMAGMWGGRLALHIYRRALRHPEEDSRYRYLRQHWHTATQIKFFLFFQAQGLAAMVFSLPYWAIAQIPGPTPPAVLTVAAVIWLVSIAGESFADWQLTAWRAAPGHCGRTCRTGLWAYSRHPNYFFEWLHWWSYVVLSHGSPYWWIALLIQGLMFMTLNYLSGIPHAERQALLSKGDDYREYQSTTPRFFPWRPKRHAQPRH